jgi:hypothetical protein
LQAPGDHLSVYLFYLVQIIYLSCILLLAGSVIIRPTTSKQILDPCRDFAQRLSASLSQLDTRLIHNGTRAVLALAADPVFFFLLQSPVPTAVLTCPVPPPTIPLFPAYRHTFGTNTTTSAGRLRTHTRRHLLSQVSARLNVPPTQLIIAIVLSPLFSWTRIAPRFFIQCPIRDAENATAARLSTRNTTCPLHPWPAIHASLTAHNRRLVLANMKSRRRGATSQSAAVP